MPLSRTECYEVLEISSDASEDEVRVAYKKLALRTHPDKNPNNPEAHAKFLKISEAYKRLSNPDSFRHDEDDGNEWNNYSDDEEVSEQMKEMFQSMFAGMFHFSASSRQSRDRNIFEGSIDMMDILNMMASQNDYDDDYYDEDDDDEDYDDDDDELSESDLFAMMMDELGGLNSFTDQDFFMGSSSGSGRGRKIERSIPRPSLYGRHKIGKQKTSSSKNNEESRNRSSNTSFKSKFQPKPSPAADIVETEKHSARRRQFKPRSLPHRKSLYKKRRTASESDLNKQTSSLSSQPSSSSSSSSNAYTPSVTTINNPTVTTSSDTATTQTKSKTKPKANNSHQQTESSIKHENINMSSTSTQQSSQQNKSSSTNSEMNQGRDYTKRNEVRSTYFDEPDSDDDGD